MQLNKIFVSSTTVRGEKRKLYSTILAKTQRVNDVMGC